MKNSVAAWCLVALAVVLVAAQVRDTAAANCSPAALNPCLGPITTGAAPSQQCCAALRLQEPCFCGYIHNPALKPFIDSDNAKKVVAACDITLPHC